MTPFGGSQRVRIEDGNCLVNGLSRCTASMAYADREDLRISKVTGVREVEARLSEVNGHTLSRIGGSGNLNMFLLFQNKRTHYKTSINHFSSSHELTTINIHQSFTTH